MNEALVLIAIISVFAIFAGALLWADFFTRDVKR